MISFDPMLIDLLIDLVKATEIGIAAMGMEEHFQAVDTRRGQWLLFIFTRVFEICWTKGVKRLFLEGKNPAEGCGTWSMQDVSFYRRPFAVVSMRCASVKCRKTCCFRRPFAVVSMRCASGKCSKTSRFRRPFAVVFLRCASVQCCKACRFGRIFAVVSLCCVSAYLQSFHAQVDESMVWSRYFWSLMLEPTVSGSDAGLWAGVGSFQDSLVYSDSSTW